MNIKISRTKNNFSSLIITLFFIIFLLTAKNVLASELRLEKNSKNITVGDTVSVDVIINTEGELVNVVEGDINISNNLDLIDIKELSSADSVLSQWVRSPSWLKKDNTISFIGGLPGGFNQKTATLFRIYFTAKAAGQIILSPNNVKVYANDGLATPIGVHFTPLNITINEQDSFLVEDELQAVVTKDFKSPTNINIDLGQDESLFDGQKFINISALDIESGVAYFEVKEGNRASIKTSNAYVLQNQDKLEPLVIFAFDKAGNVSKKILTPYSDANQNNYLFIFKFIILIAGLFGALLILYRIIKRRLK
jgi:hypothetical protein